MSQKESWTPGPIYINIPHKENTCIPLHSQTCASQSTYQEPGFHGHFFCTAWLLHGTFPGMHKHLLETGHCCSPHASSSPLKKIIKKTGNIFTKHNQAGNKFGCSHQKYYAVIHKAFKSGLLAFKPA